MVRVTRPIWEECWTCVPPHSSRDHGPAHLDDANLFAVGLAEQRQRAEFAGPRQRHVGRRHVEVGADRLVGGLLHVGPGRLVEPRGPGEVQPQVARLVVGAALQSRRAQDLTQRGVHHVRARMRLTGAEPPLPVHGRQHLGPADQLPVDDPDPVHDQPPDRPLDVEHLQLDPVARDPAGIGVLAAGLGVERGLVQDDLDHRARPRRRHGLAVHHDAAHLGRGAQLAVAGELGRPERAELAVDLHRLGAGLLGLRVRLGPVLLLLHQPAEAVGVHPQALLGGHLQGQVDREPVRVVQLEGPVTAELGLTLPLGVAHREVEDLRSRGQRAPEGLLLGVRDLGDPAVLRPHLRIGLAASGPG